MSFPFDHQIDQATQLRALIQQSAQANAHGPTENPLTAHTIAITSGKGGVGKTVLALNLAIALAKQGQRVCLLDAGRSTSHLAFLCGLNTHWNLQALLNGSQSLQQILHSGPAGIQLLTGTRSLFEWDPNQQFHPRVTYELERLKNDFDFVIIDCDTAQRSPPAISPLSIQTWILLTTLEPTSLTTTYATFKEFHAQDIDHVQILINQSLISQAQRAIQNFQRTSEHYLKVTPKILGCLPDDSVIPQSINQRTPAMLLQEQAPVCLEIHRLAEHFISHKAHPLFQDRPSTIPVPESEAAVAA